MKNQSSSENAFQYNVKNDYSCEDLLSHHIKKAEKNKKPFSEELIINWFI